ncbi:hypothetical protein QTG54_002912 [Skeletonema marinoi]|uniref:Uncharacterized protein n=1 Tax=Skeletonema marinoi TaxID=267567 RepID=A0AAD8YIW1_9STRA|nr:hypothetical protein QTG54_002912 [Skeletonema marinoi]
MAKPLLLSLALTTLQLHVFVTNGFSASTIQKRSGRNSFLQKHEQPHSYKRTPKHNILSPDELHNLAISLSKRKPGSNGFNRGWIQYRTAALDSIRYHLYTNGLPHPAEKAKFEELFFNLGVAADRGKMPSFANAGARSAYAVEFFCRAKNLADLFADTFNSHYEFPEYWLEGLRGSPILGSSDGGAYSVVSLGGGPGFDYVSSAVATSFCSYMESLRDQEETGSLSSSSLKLHATILDYEEGWGDLVHAMVHSTQTILERSTPTLSCDWGGTLFVLSEVHPRLWPEFYELLQDENCNMEEVGFNKRGRQMLLRKSSSDVITTSQSTKNSPALSEKDRKLLEKFIELRKFHERKIDAGWQRQEPKIRGAKD